MLTQEERPVHSVIILTRVAFSLIEDDVDLAEYLFVLTLLCYIFILSFF